jgi:hypothetical protein
MLTKKKMGMVGTPIIPAMVKSIKWEDRDLDRPGGVEEPISKITRTKRAGGMIEHLPSKHEALSPNPSTAPPPPMNRLVQIYETTSSISTNAYESARSRSDRDNDRRNTLKNGQNFSSRHE